MIKLRNVAIFLAFALASCGTNEPLHHFELFLSVQIENGEINYSLTDSSLRVVKKLPESADAPLVIYETESDSDTLKLIALLNAKSYDCPVQHALKVSAITFSSDSGMIHINPNINHPKELDYAVRLINSLVPEQYKLEFIDMQPAIEPDGKMRL